MSSPTSKPHPPASLYVGDLLPTVTDATLYSFFQTAGVEVLSLRICRYSNAEYDSYRRSYAYAYVNFNNARDAERALDTLNHEEIMGRSCRIMWQLRDPSIRKSGVGNIFIKNLDPTIGPKELSDTFSGFGDILSCKVVTDDNGQSKGYGFVHFSNLESAKRAIETANKKKIGSKEVYVGHFIPKKERLQQKAASWTNVFVKDIEPSVTNEDLKQIFSEFGEITSCVVMKQEDGVTSRGFGFVNFARHMDAVRAKEQRHGYPLKGKTLWCGPAQKKAERLAELERSKKSRKGTNLYIKNLEDDVTEEKLRQEFTKEQYSPIRSLKIMYDERGNSKGFGFINFTTSDGALAAIAENHGYPLPGCRKPLYVAMHEPKEIREKKLILRFQNRLKTARPFSPVFYHQPQYPYPRQPLPARHIWPQQPHYPAALPMTPYPQQLPPRNRPPVQRAPAPAPQPRRPPPQQIPRPNPQHVQNENIPELTIDVLKYYPEDQQRLLLGERLYPIISRTEPRLAGKITGMLLDSGWKIEDLLGLLQDEEKLNSKIIEAIVVLEKANPNNL